MRIQSYMFISRENPYGSESFKLSFRRLTNGTWSVAAVGTCPAGRGEARKTTKSWAFWEATFPVFLGSLGPWAPCLATSE